MGSDVGAGRFRQAAKEEVGVGRGIAACRQSDAAHKSRRGKSVIDDDHVAANQFRGQIVDPIERGEVDLSFVANWPLR